MWLVLAAGACCCSGGGRCYVTGSTMGPVPPHEPVQEAFSPDPHDVEEAQQLVAAFEQHQQQGTGAFTFRCASRAWPAWWRRCEAGAGAVRAHARCTLPCTAAQRGAAPRCCVVQHTSLRRVCGHLSSWIAFLAKRVLPALHLPPVSQPHPTPLAEHGMQAAPPRPSPFSAATPALRTCGLLMSASVRPVLCAA